MTEPIQTSEPVADQAPAPGAPDPRRVIRWPGGLGLAWLALLLMLAAAVIVGAGDATPGVSLPNPDAAPVSRMRLAFDSLPEQAIVVVSMDADLGTYPEILPAVRAAFDDLLRRGASLAFVSLTAEGRSIAAAEVERLGALGARPGSLLDLGYVAGVEAGLVRLVNSAVPVAASGSLADELRGRGGGLGAFDLALLVGGSDVGPRSWLEQVRTRLPDLPMVAIVPTFAQPEVSPYLASGQLAGLLATVRDAAAYAETIAGEGLTPLPDEPQRDEPPGALAMLAGMVAAVLVLGRLLVGSLPGISRRWPRETAGGDQP